MQAAGALGDLGPEARDTVPLLKKLLEDSNEDVRRTAAESLAKIQGTPVKAPATPTKSGADQGAVRAFLPRLIARRS